MQYQSGRMNRSGSDSSQPGMSTPPWPLTLTYRRLMNNDHDDGDGDDNHRDGNERELELTALLACGGCLVGITVICSSRLHFSLVCV